MNGFPYWQFHNERWLTGKVSSLDLDAQGLFLSFCMAAWASRGAFNICSTSVKLRFRKSAEWISDTIGAMVEIGILIEDGEKYRIKFIDEQIAEMNGVREKRVMAGRASAQSRTSTKEDTNTREEKSKGKVSTVLENVQQELNTCSTHVNTDFDTWYSAYPKKVAKQDAVKAWKNNKKNMPELETMIKKLKEQIASQEWKDKGGQYIPYPASYLNAGRWDDVVKGSTKSEDNI